MSVPVYRSAGSCAAFLRAQVPRTVSSAPPNAGFVFSPTTQTRSRAQTAMALDPANCNKKN